MINVARFALNRIICPDLDLEAFFKLAADVGLKKVELRNDLEGKGIIDELSPAGVRDLADRYGIETIKIDALQKFNLSSLRTRLLEELQQLLAPAKSIHCRAVESLGFPESSLGSLITAMHIIRETGCNRYKVVRDTFHHHLGPDSPERLQENYDINYTGLVHVSGVETEKPKEQYRDGHRVLVGPKDRLKSDLEASLQYLRG